MPIYDYQCQSCQHIKEVIQRFSDQPLVDCPECGKPELKKLVSAPSFKLTGTGWYETDFKNKGGSQSPAGGSDSAAGKADSASAKASSAKSAES